MNGLAVHVTRPGAEAERASFARALLDTLARTRDETVASFLLSQVQLVGKQESVRPLERYLVDEALAGPATAALLAIGGPQGAQAMVKALDKAPGSARLALVQALGEARSREAVKKILPLAESADEGLRQAALFALANIGDPAAGPVLSRSRVAASHRERAGAPALYLLYARRLVESGRTTEGLQAARAVLESYRQPAESQHASAALALVVSTVGAQALPDLLAAAGSPDRAFRGSALTLAERIPGSEATRRWVEKAGTAPPDVRADLVALLGRRGDAAALPVRPGEPPQPRRGRAARRHSRRGAPRRPGRPSRPPAASRLGRRRRERRAEGGAAGLPGLARRAGGRASRRRDAPAGESRPGRGAGREGGARRDRARLPADRGRRSRPARRLAARPRPARGRGRPPAPRRDAGEGHGDRHDRPPPGGNHGGGPPEPRPRAERREPPRSPGDHHVRREDRDPEGPAADRRGGAAPGGGGGDREPGRRGPVRRRRRSLPVARPRGGRGAPPPRRDHVEQGTVPHRGPGLRAPRRPVEPAGREEDGRARAGPRAARGRRGQEGRADRARRRARARVPAAPGALPRPAGPARRGGVGARRPRLAAVARGALALRPRGVLGAAARRSRAHRPRGAREGGPGHPRAPAAGRFRAALRRPLARGLEGPRGRPAEAGEDGAAGAGERPGGGRRDDAGPLVGRGRGPRLRREGREPLHRRRLRRLRAPRRLEDREGRRQRLLPPRHAPGADLGRRGEPGRVRAASSTTRRGRRTR